MIVPTACLITIAAILAGASAQIMPELVLDDGRGLRAYTVACDELHCRPVKGTDHSLKIRALDNVAATASYAAEQESREKSRFDLVLYETGKPRITRFRRSLSRRILVTMDGTVPADTIAKATQANSFEVPAFSTRHLILSFSNPGDSLRKLQGTRKLPGIAMARPLMGYRKTKRFTPNDPLYAWDSSNTDYQWHLNNTGQNGSISGHDINVSLVWDSYLGSGITIGIVDDGLEVTHPDLSPNVNTTIDHDWNDNSPDDPTPKRNSDDHGTSCAGVAAARGNNSIGVTGAAPLAGLVGLRLIAGDTTVAEDAEALAWRTDVIDISSNSWGEFDSGDDLYPLDPLVADAFAHSVQNGRGGRGVIYLWAAGNGREFDDYSNYEGYNNAPETISVGAVNYNRQQSYYSEPGANVLVCAPSDADIGEPSITTTTLVANGSYTDEFGGTSSATPLVAGVVALILEANPDLGWRDVQEILIRSSAKIDSLIDPGWSTNGAGFTFHHGYGAGMVDAAAAVTLAENWQNLGLQQSVSLASEELLIAIPDGIASGLDATLEFPPSQLRIEHVRLTVDIDHNYRGDLAITLTSPQGTVSRFSEVHDDPHNGMNYTFLSVHHWGESSAGTWTLNVSDGADFDAGTLNAFSLEFLGSMPTNSYDQWLVSEFSAIQILDPDISGENADPDGDGRVNLLEYATGGNPHAFDLTGEPVLVNTGGTLSLQYIANTVKTDLIYQVKISTDLITWSSAGEVVTARAASLETREVTLATKETCFARLEVTRQSP
jgi:subtilisin family serine protease/subtilisin-like proprotein convertase family protein